MGFNLQKYLPLLTQLSLSNFTNLGMPVGFQSRELDLSNT
jgi:hypothetical protein